MVNYWKCFMVLHRKMRTKLVVWGNVYLFNHPTSIKGQFQHLSLRSRDGQIKPSEDLEHQTWWHVKLKAAIQG